MTRPFRWPYSESCAGGAKPPAQPRPPEPPAPPTTRRNLLGTTVAGLATGSLMGGVAITVTTPETLPIVREPHPDTDVLIACREFDDLERRSLRAYDRARTLQAEIRADQVRAEVKHRQGPLLDRILGHRCETLDGLRAKARTLALWDPEALRPSHYWNSTMQASLLGDLLGIDPFDEAQAIAARRELRTGGQPHRARAASFAGDPA